ncbi:hypothetical protein EMIHUDRAFT_105794 [Emiliania huxleyi CCMP1516]|uniref:Cilia- and flagella-associated protein 58 central coiled coil domain-containing protein n=2 Tax=Emiliania huxleyi TaxID=2903 RepID=A0A0D3ICV7_EMIH1|nr:hypothetical protein EMIHUDRAFT_105794 [Emiliania huxleyi CCMP1516]EOD09092.1 hypothetical protein EMIHUDRAFT_105794 [Emiliania huxleyi CCMP1516]|eukprot:XP_005761521.1 hypothetical protein EMIHUDRAFT_105794 [Emiliania huxleyi CCMP1516]
MAEAASAQDDLSASSAYATLDALLSEGKLTQAELQLYKSKFAKLHAAVLQTYDNEAKQLNAELAEERRNLDEVSRKAEEGSETTAALRAEVAKGEAELAVREERVGLTEQELEELQKVHQDLEGDIASVAARQAAELTPQIEALEAAVDEARAELAKSKASLAKVQRDRNEVQSRYDELRQARTDVEARRAQLAVQLVKVKSEPDKVKKQADAVAGALAALEAESAKQLDTLRGLDGELAHQVKRRKELEEGRMGLEMAVERHHAMIEQKERTRDEMLKQLDLLKEEAVHAATERTRLAMEVKDVSHDARREADALNRKVREYNQALRRCKKVELALNNSLSQHPFLQRQLDEVVRQVAALRDAKAKNDEAAEEIRRDVDVHISNLLKQETAEEEKKEWLVQLMEDVKALEADLAEVTKEEHDNRKVLARLSAEREAAAREAAKVMQSAKDVHEELKVKELVIMDLTKRVVDSATRLKDFSKLYDAVKIERNKYVTKIQTSAQALAEMKEKMKILQNEVEILRAESAQKDRALHKERIEHTGSFNARDQLRAETNRLQTCVREKEKEVGQLAAEAENLNAVVSGIEREMVKLKRQYEVAVEERNYTGLQLIDRNDELCILYEKSNLQQSALKAGEAEIRKREEEIRAAELQVAELARNVEAARRRLPRIPQLEEEVALLKAQLEEARQEAQRLSSDLEAPDNSGRWRKLEGTDPEPEELVAKLHVLEERLNDKKEQLLEKELVLEEVTNLSLKLKARADEGREEALELSKRVNEFQGKIKGTTRRMMATVSELSMYQATAMKLAHENQQREAALREQEANVQAGLPPSDEVEREWLRHEADMRRRRAEALKRSAQQQEEPPPFGAPSTAAPFKPSELGSTMRHTRKPVLREIEI